MLSLSLAEARRLALRAQGFGRPRPRGRVGRPHVIGLFERIGLVQIDAVNVLVRAHYLPLHARLGAYDPAILDGLVYRERALFEYWGHEASLLPVELQPFLRWRMARAASGEAWIGLVRFARRRRDYVAAVYDEVAARGPLRAGALSSGGRRRGPWWGWADGKRALEWLFWTGRIAVAGRERFERLYDLTERVLPPEVLARPTPTPEAAHAELLLRAARALGVGTARDLADYFRLRLTDARPRLAELVEAGRLEAVTVEGWREPAYRDPGSGPPRPVEARAVLAPFDPLVWERSRVGRLFGLHFRLELYTPRADRRYGYYVLPFLLGETLVARIDAKADRAAKALLVPAAHLEPGARPEVVALALLEELRALAGWLGLERVVIGPRGNLARTLRRVVAAARDEVR